MSVTITFSSTNGGSPFSSPVSYGNITNGNITPDQTIFVRHNGANPITGVGLYLDVVDPGSYSGDFTALADKTELISWGDAASTNLGGVQLNLNATGSFPGSSWPTSVSKTTVDTFGINIRTGVGDTTGTMITLPTATGATSSGTIQTGSSPNVSFKARVAVPQSVTTLGSRHWKLKLVYNYTS